MTSKDSEATNRWPVDHSMTRQMITVAAAVVAALLQLGWAAPGHADPCPSNPDIIPVCPIEFPDGNPVEDNVGVLVEPAQDDGHWHANDIKPPPAVDQVNVPTATPATVVGEDVDVYNAKNEPDGAGQVVGILRLGTQVQPVGSCAPESWCQVNGFTLPNGTSTGWVWGHLQLP